MSTVSVNVTGTADVLQGIAAYERRVREGAERVVAKYALLIERDAKGLAPVDTGQLRASIRHVLEGLAARVIAGEDLPDARAVFMEFGTSKAAAQPYLVPALEMHRAAFVEDLRGVLR